MKDIPTFIINGKPVKFWHTDYQVVKYNSMPPDEAAKMLPFKWQNKHYLNVINKLKGEYEFYCFESDLFMGETDVPWILKP